METTRQRIVLENAALCAPVGDQRVLPRGGKGVDDVVANDAAPAGDHQGGTAAEVAELARQGLPGGDGVRMQHGFRTRGGGGETYALRLDGAQSVDDVVLNPHVAGN